MWALLKADADVDARRAAVARHNAESLFVKKGLSMAACRFVMSVDAKPAIVSIHHDASVHVTSAGHEMGQVRRDKRSFGFFVLPFLFFFLLTSTFSSFSSSSSSSSLSFPPQPQHQQSQSGNPHQGTAGCQPRPLLGPARRHPAASHEPVPPR